MIYIYPRSVSFKFILFIIKIDTLKLRTFFYGTVFAVDYLIKYTQRVLQSL